jgi:hypothetical protein
VHTTLFFKDFVLGQPLRATIGHISKAAPIDREGWRSSAQQQESDHQAQECVTTQETAGDHAGEGVITHEIFLSNQRAMGGLIGALPERQEAIEPRACQSGWVAGMTRAGGSLPGRRTSPWSIDKIDAKPYR